MEALQFHIFCVPILIIFFKGKLAVVHPIRQDKWAAANDAFRICAQCVAILVDVILSLREEIDGGKQRWRRLREGNFQRAVIDDFHADFGWIHFSCNRLREIDNCRIVAGKSKCIGRSCLTDQSAGVILGGDLLTITPVVLPQMEGVNQTVIRDVPTLRTSRGNDAILNARQRFQNVIEYISVLNHTKSCHIKNGRLIGKQYIQILILIQFPILIRAPDGASCTGLLCRIGWFRRAGTGGAAFWYRCALASCRCHRQGKRQQQRCNLLFHLESSLNLF